MENKIKIGQDTAKFNFIAHQINGAVEVINTTLKTALDEIGVELTEDSLKKCYGGKIEEIKADYFQKVNEDAANIRIPSARKTFVENAKSAFTQFDAMRLEALVRVPDTIRQYLTVVNGVAEFGQTEKDQLNEDCGIYITDFEEIRRYRLHVAACEALNNFFEGTPSPQWNSLFIPVNGRFVPELANYQYINNKIKQSKTK